MICQCNIAGFSWCIVSYTRSDKIVWQFYLSKEGFLLKLILPSEKVQTFLVPQCLSLFFQMYLRVFSQDRESSWLLFGMIVILSLLGRNVRILLLISLWSLSKTCQPSFKIWVPFITCSSYQSGLNLVSQLPINLNLYYKWSDKFQDEHNYPLVYLTALGTCCKKLLFNYSIQGKSTHFSFILSW